MGWRYTILSWSMVSNNSAIALCIVTLWVNVCLAYFIRPFYKMMLKKKITLSDMQSVVCVQGRWCIVQ